MDKNNKNSKNKISCSSEDYLKAIYFLQEMHNEVRVTDLADKLNISKPSVTRAVNNLKKRKLVEHENYGLLKLTPNGFVFAKSIVIRHIILKKFLCDLLGVDKKIADIEACKLEHSMSNGTINKLKKYLKKVGL